jgi:hypothetical protein
MRCSRVQNFTIAKNLLGGTHMRASVLAASIGTTFAMIGVTEAACPGNGRD